MAVPSLKQWSVLIACVIAGAGASAVVVSTTDETFTAGAQVLLTPVNQVGQGTPFGSLDYVEQRARSYAAIVGSADYRDRVAERAGVTPSTVELEARTVASTALVEVRGTAASEELARDVTQQASVLLVEFIGSTEGSPTQPSFLRADEVQGANTGAVSVEPSALTVWSAGPLAGLFVGGALFLALGRRSGRRAAVSD